MGGETKFECAFWFRSIGKFGLFCRTHRVFEDHIELQEESLDAQSSAMQS